MNERYYSSVVCCVEQCVHCTKHEWFYTARYCHCSVTHVLQLNHEQFWLPFRLKYKHTAIHNIIRDVLQLKIYNLFIRIQLEMLFGLNQSKICIKHIDGKVTPQTVCISLWSCLQWQSDSFAKELSLIIIDSQIFYYHI